jgi:PTS system mannitol-specific IIC component
MTEAAPRTLRRIVFAYSLDFFPGSLIIGCNQLRRKVERAGFDVAVSTYPIESLPADADFIFVPAELEIQTRAAAPEAVVEPLETLLNHPAYNRLIEQLEQGTHWTAPHRVDVPEAEGKTVQYRGYQRID